MKMNNDSPKVSIIVPIYKVEQYLRRCLDSIAAQTFTDWECILIDDGSPDNSGTICDEYATKDYRFKVIHQKNTGVSAARNAGLDAAKGEWICWIDSDDWVENDFLATFLDTAQNNNSDIITCNYYRKDDVFNGFIGKDTSEAINNIVSGKTIAFLWIKFFKADIFNTKHIRCNTQFDVTEDVVLCIEFLLNASSVTHIDKALYHYNIDNENSLTYSLSDDRIKQIILATKVIEDLLSENENFCKAIKIRKTVTKIWILQKALEIQKEYIELYNCEKLYKICDLTWKRRIILFLCEHKFYNLLRVILQKRIVTR